jgi:Rrf2 family transcriptional regulator, iron-sulfur cluster assembly transcription factor
VLREPWIAFDFEKDDCMRLTTKGRFAVTAMMDLAMRQGGGPVSLASISERQKISLSYLEQLFGRLRREGLVTSVRGPGGGYRMGKPQDDISVSEIILAVDEPIDTTGCAGQENCKGDNAKCLTHDLWMSLNERIFDYLGSVTLGHLVAKQKAANEGVVEIVDHRSPRQDGMAA